MIGFNFTSDWLRKWREGFKPITKRRNAKLKQTQNTFDTQVKTALTACNFKLRTQLTQAQYKWRSDGRPYVQTATHTDKLLDESF